MDADLLLAKAVRKMNKWMEPRRYDALLRSLAASNLTSAVPIVSGSGDGPIVSLTTHGKRMEQVHLAIESIGRGSLKPARLILWLDDPATIAHLPASLKRLQKRGLEIVLSENFGPHTKYFPYARSVEKHLQPLATADDDILYPRDWLARLAAAYREAPQMINCFRAHVIGIDSAGRVLPYLEWTSCESRVPSVRHFATGVSGVIYPPAFLDILKAQETAFLACAPRADDIWLHATAIRFGYKIRQIVRLGRHFPIAPHTQEMGLLHENAYSNGNDPQVAATYRQSDIAMMAAAPLKPLNGPLRPIGSR